MWLSERAGFPIDDDAWALQLVLLGRSRRSGGSPTTASGRCAARAGTSSTRRSLRGSRSIVRSPWSSHSERPQGSGEAVARDPRRRSTPTCASAATTQSSATFVQSYDDTRLDASVLMIPLVGFLPGDDPRVLSTIDVLRRDLTVDGLVPPLPTRRRRRRDRRTRRGVPRVQLLDGRRARARSAITTRPGSCSTTCSASRTTSGCSPRSTTLATDGCSATSRRPSRTSRSWTRPRTSVRGTACRLRRSDRPTTTARTTNAFRGTRRARASRRSARHGARDQHRERLLRDPAAAAPARLRRRRARPRRPPPVPRPRRDVRDRAAARAARGTRHARVLLVRLRRRRGRRGTQRARRARRARRRAVRGARLRAGGSDLRRVLAGRRPRARSGAAAGRPPRGRPACSR